MTHPTIAEELFIGLMSGTSMDGIDAALVAFVASDKSPAGANAEPRLRVVETLFTEFDKTTRQAINEAAQNNQSLWCNQDSPLHKSLAPLYASACDNLLKKADVPASKISAIANHGQTVRHEPNARTPFSLQLGDGQILADLTGIKTITQFRQADLAAGGQGAPLMPAFHKAVFADYKNAFILNIGGISNVTCLADPVIGFDTGPGNILMDAWCEKHTGKRYDRDAQWAKSGKLNRTLLDTLMSDPYLAMQPPKSTGREHYHLEWLEKQCLHSLNAEDVQRTLCEFTAASIAQHINPYKCGSSCEVLVCGGGANNPLLLERLKVRLPEWNVLLTSDRGVSEDYLEAMAFAWLARQRIHNQPNNMPSVTGAKRKASLGVLYSATGGLA